MEMWASAWKLTFFPPAHQSRKCCSVLFFSFIRRRYSIIPGKGNKSCHCHCWQGREEGSKYSTVAIKTWRRQRSTVPRRSAAPCRSLTWIKIYKERRCGRQLVKACVIVEFVVTQYRVSLKGWHHLPAILTDWPQVPQRNACWYPRWQHAGPLHSKHNFQSSSAPQRYKLWDLRDGEAAAVLFFALCKKTNAARCNEWPF